MALFRSVISEKEERFESRLADCKSVLLRPRGVDHVRKSKR